MNFDGLLNRYFTLFRKKIMIELKSRDYFALCLSREIQTTPGKMDNLYKRVKDMLGRIENELQETKKVIVQVSSLSTPIIAGYEKKIIIEETELDEPLSKINEKVKVITSEYDNIDGFINSEAQGIYLRGKLQDTNEVLKNRKELIINLTDRFLNGNIDAYNALELMKDIDDAYGILHLETMNVDLLDILNNLDLDFDNEKEL